MDINEGAFNALMQEIHTTAKEKGFWDNKERNVGEMLMLIVSELGEALEAYRTDKRFTNEKYNQAVRFEYSQTKYISSETKQLYTDAQTQIFLRAVKDTFEDELADVFIRLVDLAAGLGINLYWHIQQKMYYNKTREKLHGKKF